MKDDLHCCKILRAVNSVYFAIKKVQKDVKGLVAKGVGCGRDGVEGI